MSARRIADSDPRVTGFDGHRLPDGLAYIYALRDPRNGGVRYVGKAVDAWKRLDNHCRSRTLTSSPKNLWIQTLYAEGLRPQLYLLDVVDEGCWPEWEEHYIQEHSAGGGALLNKGRAGIGRERDAGVEWTSARAEQELREYLVGQSTFPSQAQFAADGHRDLERALHRLGGVDAWARKFGIPRQRPGRWETESDVRASLKPLLKERRTWPSKQEFREAGLGGLENAITNRFGGHNLWAGRYQLPRQNTVRWTQEMMREEIAARRDQWATWPTGREWAAMGLATPAGHIGSRWGGHDAWAEEHGLPRAGNGRFVASGSLAGD